MEITMQEEYKSLKQYAREAKKRLKEGFWQKYSLNLKQELEKAEKIGVSASRVKEYYTSKVSEDISRKTNDGDEFYEKVKELLSTEGEVPDALGRLTDKEYYERLSYQEKQRYNLNLSEQYLKAVERYNREKSFELKG